MATFKWEIFDAVDKDEQTQVSGEIGLGNVQVALGTPRWAVEMPDRTLVLIPNPGGPVYLPEALPIGEDSRRRDDHSNRVRNFIRVSLVLLFAFGFVAIILHDLQSGGSLSFDRYMSIIAAFMGGLGAATLGK